MGHSPPARTGGTVGDLEELSSLPRALVVEESIMKLLKSQAIRVLLALSALASSAVVLEAGKRWF